MMKICTVEGCEQRAVARKLCNRHYQQQYRSGELAVFTLPDEAKHGSPHHYRNRKCRCELCVIAWNAYCAGKKAARVGAPLKEGAEHGRETSYQLGCRCDPCRKAHSVYVSDRRNLDTARIKELEEQQAGLCACCKKPYARLVVDHIHGTSYIRGLLCNGCNTGIGKLGDDIEGVTRALAYLNETLPA